jgi:cyclohexanone monooxygenase
VQERLLLARQPGWFTGYNSNVDGHADGKIRYQAYFGGALRYRAAIAKATEDDYAAVDLS